MPARQHVKIESQKMNHVYQNVTVRLYFISLSYNRQEITTAGYRQEQDVYTWIVPKYHARLGVRALCVVLGFLGMHVRDHVIDIGKGMPI